MIVFSNDEDEVLEIPVGLGCNVSQEAAHPLQNKQVDPSTSELNVTADSDYYGLNQVTVNGVTSSIDSNIIESNIRKDVTILGVTGNLESETVNNQDKTVNSSTIEQNITADNGYTGLGTVTVNPYTLDTKTVNSSTVEQVINSSADGLSSVTVNPYTLDTKTVDSSTVSQTVISDEDGLSSVTVNPYTLDNKTVNPSTNSQTITSDEDGLASVTVNPVTAAIDPDIIASNIRKDVDILGVVGNFEGGTLQSKTVNSSTVSQTVEPDGANYGLSSVTVNPYSVEAKSDTITINGQYSYSPSNSDALSSVTIDVQVADIPAVIQTKSVTYNHNGNYTVTKDTGYDGMSSVDVSVLVTPVLESAKSVNSSTVSQTVTYDNTNYDGLSSVTVNPYTLENKTVNSSTVSQSVTASTADGLAMVTVNPYTLDSKTVDPSTNSQTVTSSEDGLSSVTVNAVNSNIDPNILSNNIKNGVTILGVTGSYSGTVINNQNKTVDSSTVSQSITADNGYTGLGTVTVTPYSLESQSDTIHSSGQYSYVPSQGYDGISQIDLEISFIGQVKNEDPSTNAISVEPDWPYEGLSQVNINAVTSSIDSNIAAGNIKNGVTILGVTGSYSGTVINNQNKTVDSSTVSQSVSSDSGYTGLGTVTVNPYTVESDTSTLTSNGIYTFTPTNANALSSVTVDVSVASQTPVLQDVSLNYNTNGTYTINASSGYDGLGTVDISVNVSGSGGGDWIIEVKAGNITDLSSYSLPEPTNNYQYYHLFERTGITKLPDLSNWTQIANVNATSSMFTNCSSLTSVDLSSLIRISGSYATTYMFYGCSSLTSVDLSNLTIISGADQFFREDATAEGMFSNCSSLTSVDLSSLTIISGNYYAAHNMFEKCSSLTSVDLSNLTTISGYGAANHMFNDCSCLTSVDLSSLTRISGTYAAYNMFNNCNNLITMISHPNVWGDNSSESLIYNSLQYLRNLTFTALTQENKNVYLTNQSNLTSDSVLSVLTHLNPDYPGTCSFYSSGLTVTDDAQGSLQTAYNAAVNAGWTINNLTIIPNS